MPLSWFIFSIFSKTRNPTPVPVPNVSHLRLSPDFKFKPPNGIACILWLFFIWLRDGNSADAAEWLAIVAVTQISAIYKGICMLLGMPRTTETTQIPTQPPTRTPRPPQ